MTIKEQIKILDDQIRQNKADYDFYRQNARISALSSGKLDKYEYLTGEDSGYRPDPIQKPKFEYSPLDQVFNKGLGVNEKQEGLLKMLKNIEDKTDNQLDLVRDQGDKQLDLIGKTNIGRAKSIGFQNEGNEELKKLEDRIRDKEKKIRGKDNDKDKDKIFVYTAKYLVTYDFSKYIHLMNFAEDVYKEELPLDEAKDEQKEMLKNINKLKKIIYPKTVPGPKKANKTKMKNLVKMQKIFIK